MEWDKLWALNKQLLDPIVPRYMAVDGKHHVTLTMAGAPKAAAIERELHPKNPSVGKVPQILTGQVLLELEDAEKIECGEEVTLMRWGNAIVDKVLKEDDVVVGLEGRLHLEGDVKKTKKKLHWLPLTNAATVEGHDAKLTTIVVRELDHLITKKKLEESDDFESVVNHHTIYDTECLADPAVKQLKEGDCIQLERRGYFRVDVPHSAGAAMVMIAIPDGRTKSMSGLSTKVDLKTQAKGR
ncbi:MAG: uncharacterized protein KVP18_002739 [Porospora cf. gigantea A]|uniref:uncharacterized protein n=1 Tax=Porospora cf. gigantea A TaxID=2853593 RepID=UPI00355A0F48|nr:MAG: hypothetical protein KVP18_002739 [Porospora cf. gigantea A]